MAQESKHTMSSLLMHEPKPLPNALSNLEDLQPFSEVRLIAFDLDGTLIEKADSLPGERLKKLIDTVGRHIHITLATGRTLAGVSNIVSALDGINKHPLVLYNGSVLMSSAEKLLINRRVINSSAVQSILSTCDGKDIGIYLYSVDPEANFLNSALCTESVYYLGPANFRPVVDYNNMRILDFHVMTPGVTQVVAILLDCRDIDTKLHVQKALEKVIGISITVSGSKYIEIRPVGSSKALGLEELCNRMGIKRTQVLAMGDNDNDAELLEWAGISVCVKDASPLARKTSKYCSSHGAGKAAIEVLEIIRRAQRLFKKEKKNGR